MNEQRIRRRLVVSGRVQGVAFRASTEREARARGLDGWVCNRADGRVEAVFEGPPDAVSAVLAWCHEGPRFARVSAVEIQEEAPEGLSGFRIR
jgi:acylphosphatase